MGQRETVHEMQRGKFGLGVKGKPKGTAINAWDNEFFLGPMR